MSARDRDKGLQRRYGITLLTRDSMASQQSQRCLLCHQVSALCVDHDHETGKVRGLLCILCNARLGVYEAIRRNDIWRENADRYLAWCAA